jgi:hypothetical protein
MMKAAMADGEIRAKGTKDAPKMAADAVKAYANAGEEELAARSLDLDETAVLRESAAFLGSEFACDVVVQNADDAALDDPAGKSRFAQPRKPAVFIE